MPMNMVERPQQTAQMRNGSTNNQAMHNLVTRTPDIKPVWIPLLRDLYVVSSPFLSFHIEYFFRLINIPSEHIPHPQ